MYVYMCVIFASNITGTDALLCYIFTRESGWNVSLHDKHTWNV